MPTVAKPLGQVQLGTALTTICAVPTAPTYAMKRIQSLWITNTDTVAHTVSLRIGTGVLTVANSLMEGRSLAPNTSLTLAGEILLSAGQTLQGFADVAAKATVTAFGEETT
jgi:hypothetical protein